MSLIKGPWGQFAWAELAWAELGTDVVSASDVGVGTDVINVLVKALFITDSGIGVEILAPDEFIDIQDSGIGVEVATIQQMKYISDVGIGVEAIKERGFVIPDNGVGVESFLHAWDVIIIIG